MTSFFVLRKNAPVGKTIGAFLLLTNLNFWYILKLRIIMGMSVADCQGWETVTGTGGLMEIKILKIKDIKPYERNARKNDKAVDAVAKSIEQCTYIAPIVVDENHVILAGHTRWKAMKKLGKTECECIVKSGLTEEQKKKYRLLDNKTNELADWDFDLLANELEGLDFDDLELDWGIEENAQEEFERKDAKIVETISVVVECENDEEAEELFEKLSKEGYQCRISTL